MACDCLAAQLQAIRNHVEQSVELQNWDHVTPMWGHCKNCSDVTMSVLAFQITGNSTVCSNFSPGAHQRKHQSSESLAVVRGIRRWPVDSPHIGPLTRKMFSFDDVIMMRSEAQLTWLGPGVPPARDDTVVTSRKLSWGVVQYKDRLIYVWRFPC